jgi:hypothetical protein
MEGGGGVYYHVIQTANYLSVSKQQRLVNCKFVKHVKVITTSSLIIEDQID